MATFTDNTPAAAAMPMEEDENKAPPDAADAAKDEKAGAATPGVDGKPTDMTRCACGEGCAGGRAIRRPLLLLPEDTLPEILRPGIVESAFRPRCRFLVGVIAP